MCGRTRDASCDCPWKFNTPTEVARENAAEERAARLDAERIAREAAEQIEKAAAERAHLLLTHRHPYLGDRDKKGVD